MTEHWPRSHRPELSVELDFDRPCLNCGYNLRGMPSRSPCPECGSIGGWNYSDDAIPWDEFRDPAAFFNTLALALLHPRHLAKHVWRPVRMDVPAASRFRHAMLWAACPILCAVSLVVTARLIGWSAALVTLPFSAAALVVWLNAVTLHPLGYVRRNSHPRVVRQAEAVVHYLSATLVLTPLHIVLVYGLSFVPLPDQPLGAIAAAGHFVLLCLTLLPGMLGHGWLIFELIEVPPATVAAVVFADLTRVAVSGLVMLAGVPALASTVARALVGG